MFSIIKNICTILFRRKSFFITTFILPIAIVLVFSAMFSSVEDYKVAILNKDTGKLGEELQKELEESKGFKLINVDKDENLEEDVAFHKYEMALIIDEDFSSKLEKGEKSPVRMVSIGESEQKAIITNIIQSKASALSALAANFEINDDIITTYGDSKPELTSNESEKKANILNSFGMILYMIVISAGICCSFALEDEKEGTKDRVLMSDINEKQYFFAQSMIYLVLSLIPAVEYYVVCVCMDYEFGFKDKYVLLIILALAVLLTVVFNLFLSSVVKNKNAYNLMVSTCSIPIFMLSGAFWSFDFMSSTLQKIGEWFPPRWIMKAIIDLQEGVGVIDALLPMLVKTLLLTIVLFILCIVCTAKKIVIIKEHK